MISLVKTLRLEFEARDPPSQAARDHHHPPVLVTVCRKGKQHLPVPDSETYRAYEPEIIDLVFFRVSNSSQSILQRHRGGVPMLFDSSRKASGAEVPTIYLAPLKNVLPLAVGRVPLMPCYYYY